MELLSGSSFISSFTFPKSGLESAVSDSILADYTPVVMAISSPSVERICGRNNLTFVDLLRAHSSLRNVNGKTNYHQEGEKRLNDFSVRKVPVRTAGEHPYRIPDFSVRIFYPNEMIQPDKEVFQLPESNFAFMLTKRFRLDYTTRQVRPI